MLIDCLQKYVTFNRLLSLTILSIFATKKTHCVTDLIKNVHLLSRWWKVAASFSFRVFNSASFHIIGMGLVQLHLRTLQFSHNWNGSSRTLQFHYYTCFHVSLSLEESLFFIITLLHGHNMLVDPALVYNLQTTIPSITSNFTKLNLSIA